MSSNQSLFFQKHIVKNRAFAFYSRAIAVTPRKYLVIVPPPQSDTTQQMRSCKNIP